MNTMQRATLTALFTITLSPAFSQFIPDLQAKTPEEYDAYLDVLEGASVQKAEAFERAFPESALRLPVCEILTRQWRSRGNLDQAIAAAERGLAIAPDYAPLLVAFADLLANASRRLDRAEGAARRALELLTTIKAPIRVTPEEWTSAVSKLRAGAHGALGMIRFKRDDTAGAAKEFEAALAETPNGNPVLHYRLGRLYAAGGRTAEARAQLRKAANSSDPALRERARMALAELR